MRVAVTIEQAWHRVPGGTAWSVLELFGPSGATASTSSGSPPGTASPPPEPWRPVRSATCPCPAPALYEAWHAAAARVERATGPVDVVHATARRLRGPGPRGSSRSTTSPSCTTPATTPREPLRVHRGLAAGPPRGGLGPVPVRGHPRECVEAGFDDGGCGCPRGPPTRTAVRPGRVAPCASAMPSTAPTSCSPARSNPARTCLGWSRRSAASTAPTPSSSSSGPTAGTGAAAGRPPPRVPAARRCRRAARRRGRRRLPQPARGVRAPGAGGHGRRGPPVVTSAGTVHRGGRRRGRAARRPDRRRRHRRGHRPVLGDPELAARLGAAAGPGPPSSRGRAPPTGHRRRVPRGRDGCG